MDAHLGGGGGVCKCGEYPLLMDVTEVGTHFLLWMPTCGVVCKCGEYPLLMDVTEVGTHILLWMPTLGWYVNAVSTLS